MAARLSRKERARRAAISRGLRRYWRQVHRVAKVQHVSVREARPLVREIRSEQREKDVSFRRALMEYVAARPRPSFIPPSPEGEVAFNLRDRSDEQGFRLFERFRGQTEVVLSVNWEFYDRPGHVAASEALQVRFAPGATEDEFWSNYFAAIRDVHDDALADQGAAPGAYARFAFFVSGMA